MIVRRETTARHVHCEVVGDGVQIDVAEKERQCWCGVHMPRVGSKIHCCKGVSVVEAGELAGE